MARDSMGRDSMGKDSIAKGSARGEEHLAPLTDDLLRLAIDGLRLPEREEGRGESRAKSRGKSRGESRLRVADLCCGIGAASRLLATEYGAVCTGIDTSEVLLRAAREQALASHVGHRPGSRWHGAQPDPLGAARDHPHDRRA